MTQFSAPTGSPIETGFGWLVLTHGVGPTRDYAMGALLLYSHQPYRVIAELPGTLLTASGTEREGYVPVSCTPVKPCYTPMPYGCPTGRATPASDSPVRRSPPSSRACVHHARGSRRA
ncbi:hypothetical protein GCM10018965_050030 [Nonomuraea roseola]